MNQMTNVSDVFAGGGLVRSRDLVVKIIRDSCKAAAGIPKILVGTRRMLWLEIAGMCRK